MLLKCGVEFREARGRNPFTQKLLAAGVSDCVDHETTQRRSSSRHENVQKQAVMVLRDITTHHDIHGQADCGAV